MAQSLEYTKNHRRMPFLKRGMIVEVNGKRGRITSGYGGYIMVRFDGMSFSRNCHPQWETVYYGKDGEIIADYRAGQKA